MGKGANAVLALSRAFYGKRLTDADYDALTACRSLSECASYLRSHTVYADVLSALGSPVTAQALEELVTKQRFERFSSLCRYELAIRSAFYQYFLIKNEVEQILRCTMSLLAGNTELYLMQLSPFLDKHLRIDLFSLGKANTLQDVQNALRKTPYEKLFRSCMTAEHVSFLTFELAFQSYFETEVRALVKKCYSGKERQALQTLICRSLDVKLISAVYRAKRYYRDELNLKSVSLSALVSMTLLTDKQLTALMEAPSETEVLQTLQNTIYKDWFDTQSPAPLERQLTRALYELCKKEIRFSVYPGVVMFCYLLLAQTETENLIHIIEGIKFQVPAQTLRAELVLV